MYWGKIQNKTLRDRPQEVINMADKTTETKTTETKKTDSKWKVFLKKKNIEISVRRYLVDAMGAMANGLFASLLIGTIVATLGQQLNIQMLVDIGTFAKGVSGPAMAVAIAYALQAPPLVLFSMLAVGAAANTMGEAGGPLAPYIGKAASGVGQLIMWATEMRPFMMGILVSVIVGIALTLPISSAAICAALSLTGLAGGAAVAGCCAQMVGFAVMSYRENKIGGLVSQGIGTSMLQMGNIIKNPKIWIPPILTSAITGPIATCVFHLEMNGEAISSGMGTCGFVGQIGVYTGWINDIAAGAKQAVTWIDWLGLILISFVLPACLTWGFGWICRKIGWIREGDLKL